MENWFCIATSGKTIDGREIQKEWLESAAKNYSKNLYQALIWDEHGTQQERNWLGNLGTVEEVKLVEENGVFKLFAKLQPNQFLENLNKQGQKIFTSVELMPDFPNDNEHYLIGLAATDQPASVGLSRLQFSAQNKQKNIFLSSQQLEIGTDNMEDLKQSLQEALAQNAQMQEKIAELEQLLKNGKTTEAEAVAEEAAEQATEVEAEIEAAQEQAQESTDSTKEEMSAIKKQLAELVTSNKKTQELFSALLNKSTTKKPGIGTSTADSIELH